MPEIIGAVTQLMIVGSEKGLRKSFTIVPMLKYPITMATTVQQQSNQQQQKLQPR